MKPQTIRLIDLWLGRTICAALTTVRMVSRIFFRERGVESSIHKILFIKMIEQGATVLAFGAIRRAIELVGRENVYFWVFEENSEILAVMDVIPPENVLTIRSKHPVSFLIDVWRTSRRIRRIGIDCTIDMEFFARAPAILAYLTGARRRIGLHRFTSEGPYRGDLMTHRVEYNPHVHTAAAYLTLVESSQTSPNEAPLLKRRPPEYDLSPPSFNPSQDDLKQVREKLNGIAGREVERPIVILNPNASDLLPLRRWPIERFVELGKRILADDPNVTLVITGSPSEKSAAAELAAEIGLDRTVNMAGETTLRELLTLYTMADVLVTNDSGPSHFASMTDIESVCLFGPETPALYGPLGKHSHIMWAGLYCSPCVNAFNHRFSPCKDNVCMQAISVEMVYDKVRELPRDRRR